MSAERENVITITLRDVYDVAQETRGLVASLGEKVKPIEDHENRLRSLERWKYSIPASLVVSGGAVLVAILTNRH
jgi:hypothetical protein